MGPVNSIYSNYIDNKTVIIASVVGFIAYPIIKRIFEVALKVLAAFGDWISERPFAIRLHSVFCADCAENHKSHMTPQKKVDTGS